jgi:biotin transport system substrate-specific component
MSRLAPSVLADLVPAPAVPVVRERSRVLARDASLVVGFALFTALAAQVSLPLGFTPVPLTGQTFAVLVAGSVLGAGRGAASQGLYFALGLAGLPVYADGQGGWDAGTGSTLGYLVGFVIAAALIGYQAERRADRDLVASVSSMAMGSVVIYACGAGWLAHHLGVPFAVSDPAVSEGRTALSMGVTPFLVGDVIKMALAGAVAPVAWTVVGRLRK